MWVNVSGRLKGYYRKLGYDIPTKINSKGTHVGIKGTSILVKVKDLKDGSGIKLTKICDECGEYIPNQPYLSIVNGRKTNGLDTCKKCSSIKIGRDKGIASVDNCIAKKDPEFSKLFLNKEDTFRYMCNSGKRVDFKCPICNRIIKGKIIDTIRKRGLSCICKDGISYPEKFMYNLLEQLEVKFEYNKLFEKWFIRDKKYFDFYLPEKHIIIETHGLQHYQGGFETFNKGRNEVEEKANDIYKYKIAIDNGISENNYIEIDSRLSDLDFMKNSILKSKLKNFFDLSDVEWSKCHEFACNSMIKNACDLWNKGFKNTNIIAEKLNLSRSTIVNYLKKGVLLNWCDYNPKEELKKRSAIVGNLVGNRNKKEIIQLSLKGDLIKKWESVSSAHKSLKISHITCCCKGKQKTSGGYKWMYKEDYDKYLEQANQI